MSFILCGRKVWEIPIALQVQKGRSEVSHLLNQYFLSDKAKPFCERLVATLKKKKTVGKDEICQCLESLGLGLC